jgi:hypothetical protein
MPRFFFDVTADGNLSRDEEGLDLPSIVVARREAVRTAAEMARDDGLSREIVIAILDASRRLLDTVRLVVSCERAA